MVASVSEFFKKNDVSLDSKIIPTKKPGLYSVKIENKNVNSELCKSILTAGDETLGITTTNTDNGVLLTSEYGTAEVFFDNSFSIEFTGKYMRDRYKKSDESKKLLEFVHNNGLLPDAFTLEFSKEGDRISAEACFKGEKIFNCIFTFTIKNERLVGLTSTGQTGNMLGYSKINARDAVNCLFDLLQDYPDLIIGSEVVSISSGYLTPSNIVSNYYLLIPTWRVTLSDGRVINYNMETAKVY